MFLLKLVDNCINGANTVGEICLTWPGKPSASHWAVQELASDDRGESEKRQKFAFLSKKPILFLDFRV